MKGVRLGAYRIESELGSGGMGTVWLARDDAGTAVAVKRVHAHLLGKPEFVARFVREGEVGRRVSHPNVVRTLQVAAAEIDGNQVPFLVMEYVQGRTLRDLIADVGPLSEALLREIAREVAAGLKAIHEAGVVHRDLKPENVLITPDHAVKIMDLGVARLADEVVRLSQSGTFAGSVHYAAPEQLRMSGADVDGRADLHALGVILHELAGGENPFLADDVPLVLRKVLEEVPRRLSEINPQISPFFEEVTARLLEKERDLRFSSAADLLATLTAGERSTWWQAQEAEARRPMRRMRVPRDTDVYGRAAELERLADLFDAVKSDRGQAVLLEGEAGIGKTRLVDEFVARLDRAGEEFHFLVGGYPPGGAATAAGAWSTAFREHFGARDLEARLARHLRATPRLIPAFAALLRGEPAPEDTDRLTKDAIHTLFVHAARGLATESPVVILIEDLHFGPDEARALLAALALAIQDDRVMLIGTVRPGLPEAWAAELELLPHFHREVLDRLGPKDLWRLLEDSFRSRKLADELGMRIGRKSDGNPYFVFEILRGLREGDYIRLRPDGSWTSARVIGDIEIPSSVMDLIRARISDLSEEQQEILDVSACIGFEFDPRLVAEVIGANPIPVLRHLGTLERAHRLVRSSGEKFVFDHHQVQEALYVGMPEQLRMEYHAVVGRALEGRGGDDVGICEQYFRGGRGQAALVHLDAALRQLSSGHLHHDVAGLADRALSEPGLIEGADRVAMLLRKEDGLSLIFTRREEQAAALAEADALAADLGDDDVRARVDFARGVFAFRNKDFAGASALFTDAHALAGDDALRADITRELGFVRFRSGEFALARETLLSALTLAAPGTVSRAVTLQYLGHVEHERGHAEAAHDYYVRALETSRESGHRQTEGKIAAALGNVYYRQGRNEEARKHYEVLLDTARETGVRLWEATATGSIANTLPRGEARAYIERTVAIARELGARDTEATATVNLGMNTEDLGLYAEALTCYRRGRDLRRAARNPVGEHGAAVWTGTLLARMGDLTGAGELLTEALTALEAIGATRQVAEAMTGLGETAEFEGDPDGAREWYRRARVIQEESAPYALPGTLAAIARLEVMEGDRSAAGRAVSDLRSASDGETPVIADVLAAVLDTSRAPGAAEALRRREADLGHGTRLAMYALLWRATGEPGHLETAVRLLTHLREHAPEEYQVSLIEDIPLHREIAGADPGRMPK